MSRGLPYTDVALDLAVDTFSSRAICLTGRHGHTDKEGRIDPSTHRFLLERLASHWGALFIGEVALSYTPDGAPSPLILDAKGGDRLDDLIAALRERDADVILGATLCYESLEDLMRLLERLGAPDVTRRREEVGGEFGVVQVDALDTLARIGEEGVHHLTEVAPEIGAAVMARFAVDPAEKEWGEDDAIASAMKIYARAGTEIFHFTIAPECASARVAGAERIALGARTSVVMRDYPDVLSMISGRIKHGEDAERARKFHRIDLVGMTRASLAAPRVLDADRQGETTIHCTGCMACEHDERSPIRFERSACALRFGPLNGALPEHLVALGASYGAMRLAWRVVRAGGVAEVWPMGGAIGGALRLRGRIPRQAESAEAALQIARQCREAGVSFESSDNGWGALPDLIERENITLMTSLLPELDLDALPLASSSLHHVSALDLLARPIHGRDPWIVVGETLLAVEVALFLEMQAIEICLVADTIASDTHPALSSFYRERLSERGVWRAPRSSLGAHDPHVDILTLDGVRQEKTANQRAFSARKVAWGDHAHHREPLVYATLRAARPGTIIVPDCYEPLRMRHTMHTFDIPATETLT